MIQVFSIGVRHLNKKLIVNADGFGFGGGATRAVFDVVREGGFVTSLSVNANFHDAGRISEFVKSFPRVSVGVHLNPLVGRPCLPPREVPTLVDENGYFHGRRFAVLLRSGFISSVELEAELNEQIARIKKLTGDSLTHIDSQANMHLSYFELFLKLARNWGIGRMRNNASLICLEAENPSPARLKAYLLRPHVWAVHKYRRLQMKKARASGMRMADALITVGYGGCGNKTNPDNWRNILRNLPEGTFEIYCHPGYPDATLRRWAAYCDERAREARLLSQGWLRETALRQGVELISFHDI